MEKQDILVVAIAVIAFAILALVILPMAESRSGGLPGGGAAAPAPVPTTARAAPVSTPAGTRPATAVPTPAVAPWDGTVKTIGFIGQPGDQVTLPPVPTIPQPPVQNRTLATYAVISGRWSGTTENIYVPTPYWVMEYTAEPLALPPDAFPVLIIQVFDAHDPNRVIITPVRQNIYEDPPDDPWTVKFYEGMRRYYFKVDTSFIRSYTITIKVPQEYL